MMNYSLYVISLVTKQYIFLKLSYHSGTKQRHLKHLLGIKTTYQPSDFTFTKFAARRQFPTSVSYTHLLGRGGRYTLYWSVFSDYRKYCATVCLTFMSSARMHSYILFDCLTNSQTSPTVCPYI